GPGGSEEIKGAWSAEAGLCDTPPMLLVEAEEPSAGTILLLALPSANRITAYPVTAVQAGLRTPPGAQLGVHLVAGPGAWTSQGGRSQARDRGGSSGRLSQPAGGWCASGWVSALGARSHLSPRQGLWLLLRCGPGR